jgi:hypothetical protein
MAKDADRLELERRSASVHHSGGPVLDDRSVLRLPSERISDPDR